MVDEITFESFQEEWLVDILAGNPSNVELGHRFAHKLITQWLDIESGADGLVYCDGSGDGGIDVAYLDRGDVGEIDGNVDTSSTGDTWYIVQSKYGKAFQGTGTLLAESQKVVDTLDGKRPRLSSLAEGLLERLTNFRHQFSTQCPTIPLPIPRYTMPRNEACLLHCPTPPPHIYFSVGWGVSGGSGNSPSSAFIAIPLTSKEKSPRLIHSR